jgi:hypothetical protein
LTGKLRGKCLFERPKNGPLIDGRKNIYSYIFDTKLWNELDCLKTITVAHNEEISRQSNNYLSTDAVISQELDTVQCK